MPLNKEAKPFLFCVGDLGFVKSIIVIVRKDKINIPRVYTKTGRMEVT